MNIAFFSDNAYPELSGIVDSILITGRTLMKRGHKVMYVGPRYRPGDYTIAHRSIMAEGEGDEERIEGMRIIRLPSVRMPFSPTGVSRIGFPTGASIPYLEAFDPDIIHFHNPFGAAFEAMRAARRLKVPLIGTNHTAIEDFAPPFSRHIMRRYDAWVYNHCQFITTPYQVLLDNMRAVGFHRAGEKLPNPIESPLFRPATVAEKAELRERMKLRGPVILYAGRLSVEKRVDDLLRGAAKLCAKYPDTTLILTGYGAEEENLKHLARDLGIERNVEFTGFIPMEALARFYKVADVFALMSTSDSQSLALMQAYASGLPAVCVGARGLPEYVPSECGFLVDPGDADALAARLEQLMEDIPLRERMGKAATQYVKQFAPEVIAEHWEALYAREIARFQDSSEILSSSSRSARSLELTNRLKM